MKKISISEKNIVVISVKYLWKGKVFKFLKLFVQSQVRVEHLFCTKHSDYQVMRSEEVNVEHLLNCLV